MRTTEEIMHRGRALEAEGYDEIPISRLLGPGWLEPQPGIPERLVACGNMIPGARSIYHWKGKVADEREVVVKSGQVRVHFGDGASLVAARRDRARLEIRMHRDPAQHLGSAVAAGTCDGDAVSRGRSGRGYHQNTRPATRSVSL